MLQLQVVYAYRRLPRCILLSHQRFVSEGTKSLRPPSKYKSELKNLITTFKKELGAVQAKEEKDAVKRKVEEQKEIQKMFRLNKLENKKIALHRYSHLPLLYPNFQQYNIVVCNCTQS